jgi:hypothetical protein
MTRLRTTIAALGAAILTTASLSVLTSSGAHAEAFNYAHLNKIQQRHVSGLLASELDGADPAARARSAAPSAPRPVSPTAAACTNRYGDNIKVNQNCLNITDPDLQGRGQAQNETWLAIDPHNPDHLVASYNDYRRGDGTCGVSYSLDGARPGPTRPHPTGSPEVPRSAATPGSTGRPAATRRSPGTPKATPTCPARSSTAAPARRPTSTSPAPSTCTARPATTALPGTSPDARSPNTTT